MPDRKPRHKRSLPHTNEYRQFRIDPASLELRSGSADSDGTDLVQLRGEPIMYNRAYKVWDMFGPFQETMHPGVAAQSLANEDDVRFLFNHDGMPLGRTASGTLRLSDSDTNLICEVDLDARQSLANDLAIAIERGDVTQMSVGFEVLADMWNDSYDERDIYQIRLFDVSAVTYPASPTTSIQLAERSLSRMPAESRARVRHLWSIAKDLREGRQLGQADGDLLLRALETLHDADEAAPEAPADEERAEGTKTDDPAAADDHGEDEVDETPEAEPAEGERAGNGPPEVRAHSSALVLELDLLGL